MRGDQQRAARSFIRAARFDADQPIFDQVDAPDAVFRRDFVQLIEQRDRGTFLAVHRHRRARIESDLDVRRLVRRFFRRRDPLPHRFLGFVRGIFEHAAFMAQVPDIAVARIDVRLGLLDGHLVRIRVGDGVLARVDGPLAPRRDDFHVRRDGFVRQLEAHLIVALARAAVRHGVGAGFESDFRLPLGDHRPRHRGAEQILVFVHRAGAQRRPDVLGQEFLAQILDCRRRSARHESFLLRGLQIFLLANVADHGDHLAAIRFLQPGNNDRRIKSARIGENYFLWHRLSFQLRSINRMAFCTCRRFSASSKTMERGDSMTSSVTSEPRCAGRQWRNTASGAAWDMSSALT